MFSVTLSTGALVLAAGFVAAQEPTGTPPSATTTPAPTVVDTRPTYGATPFASLRYDWNNLPYKSDPDVGLIRGDQHGYNICNGTTENQDSLCQTMVFNGLDDFCLWGPPEYGRSVGDIEGIMVAWCTKPGHGTRLIPEGALTGVQWTKTPGYIQAVGFLDQTKLNILEGDYGGEMDPHGADLRGNPMGGLVYTNQWGGSVPQQAPQWHNFIGNGKFCFKACDLRDPANYNLCENRLDRMGCEYNAPNAARDGVFESCLGDNQLVPGIYTGPDGVTSSYVQPWEGDFTVPYQPVVPASSSCSTFSSAALYNGLPAASTTAVSSESATSTASSTRVTTSVTRSSSQTSRSSSAASASATGADSDSGDDSDSDSSTAGDDDAGAASAFAAASGIVLLSSLLSVLYFA